MSINRTTKERNEMLIAIYDDLQTYSLRINGVKVKNCYDICLEFYKTEEDKIIDFMKRHNVHRLIVCNNGEIAIYNR